MGSGKKSDLTDLCLCRPRPGRGHEKEHKGGLLPVATLGGITVGTLTLTIGFIVGAPVVTLIVMSFRQGLPGRAGPLGLANYREVFLDPSTFRVLLDTTFFAFGTIAVTLLFALPIVWLLNRTNLPFKKTIYLLMIVGILVPTFLRTIGWILLLSPEIGLINQLARALLGLRDPPFSLYSIVGMAFVQGISFVPAAFFMVSTAYRAMDPALEEAAYTSGVSKTRTFFKINLPITVPAIAAVMVYLLMTAVSVFEVPAILGLPSGIFVLSSVIYFAVAPHVGLPKYGLAGAYGLIMLAIGLGTSLLYFRIIREGRRYEVVTGRGYRPKLIELGRYKWMGLAFMLLYFALEIFMPFAVLLWASLLPYLQVPSPEALSQVSLANYVSIPQYVGARPFLNTLVLVSVAPALSIAASIPVSWIVVRTRFRLRAVLDLFAFLPHAVPPILFAVALAYLALVYRDVVPLYGTVFVIAIAHAISYLSYGSRCMNSAMIQIHPELEEAGRACGVSPLRVIRRITVPLVSSAIFDGWLWIALLSYREVTMALVLYSPGSEVVSTLIWTMWSSGNVPQVAALGVVMIMIVLLLVGLLRAIFVRGRAGTYAHV